jgi:hypothetical protein
MLEIIYRDRLDTLRPDPRKATYKKNDDLEFIPMSVDTVPLPMLQTQLGNDNLEIVSVKANDVEWVTLSLLFQNLPLRHDGSLAVRQHTIWRGEMAHFIVENL